jgi:hypothetical protein
MRKKWLEHKGSIQPGMKTISAKAHYEDIIKYPRASGK